MSSSFSAPTSPPPPVPGTAPQTPAYSSKSAASAEISPAYSLVDNVALNRQQAAIAASRALMRSPSRTLRSPPLHDNIASSDDDTIIMQAATDATIPSVMASVAGMSLGGSAMASDDEALSAMTNAAALAAKSGVRNSAHKRTSRNVADLAQQQRPHTNASRPPLPPQQPLPQQSDSRSSSQAPSRQGHRPGKSTSETPADNSSNIVEARAPTPAMYWSRKKAWGAKPPKMRSQSMTVIGSSLYVFGGWNNNVCYNDVYVLDAETMFWSKMPTTGDEVPPCRAHTTTAVGHQLFVFGGGDGTQYFSDLYVLDTRSCIWTRAQVNGAMPSPRRTHTCFHYNGYVYLFGGGDGHRALNDLWRVRAEPDANDTYTWEEVETTGGRPFPRGYHTSTLVGNQVVVFGGSDGQECFGDTSLLNLDTMEWSHVAIDPPLTRLAHSATLVGMYLFVICGHDGSDYSNQVLMLKLDTLKWETRVIYGTAPSPRGYHACALNDGRIFLHGGYNGQDVFDDLYALELSSYSYLPQVPEFAIGCHR
ncbi:hypothetical protein H4R20_003995 [Coemansia guatemalensis]|uniref:Galactose oxidase n=1 Tax=Coemansia guatemalensis TaxID=2761395 RepID=A0A9W8LT67_9FUNG|nr:hypothetical protein H4R20_003995 [Coemansia guatemalensis]